jgi:hypothetical protein
MTLLDISNVYKLDNSDSCGIALVWVPRGGPLWMETCSNVQCVFIIQISKYESCAFCCPHVVN